MHNQYQYDTPVKILERVREVVQTVPDSEFKMEAWKEKTPCGTTACAWGHTVMQTPEFGRNWSLTDEPFKGSSSLHYLNQKPPSVFETLADYIGISKQEAVDIFHPLSYPGSEHILKAEVIARINKLLKKLRKVTK